MQFGAQSKDRIAWPLDFQRHCFRIACCLNVTVAIADHKTLTSFHIKRARRIENQFRLGFAAFASVFGRVRTDEKSIEGSEQLIDALVHRVDLLERNEASANAALIADDRELQSGSA